MIVQLGNYSVMMHRRTISTEQKEIDPERPTGAFVAAKCETFVCAVFTTA